MTQYPSLRKTQTFLPPGYKPSNDDILCGRGKVFAKHPGNQTFTTAIRVSLQAYVDAPKRIDKSIVVSALANRLREAGHRFIKYDKSRQQWFELSNDGSHEKVGHAIRDLLKTLSSQSAPLKPRQIIRTISSIDQPENDSADIKPVASLMEQSTRTTPASFLESQHRLHFGKASDFEPIEAENILSAVLNLSDDIGEFHSPLGSSDDFIPEPTPILPDEATSSEARRYLSGCIWNLDSDSDNQLVQPKATINHNNDRNTIIDLFHETSRNVNPLPLASQESLNGTEVEMVLKLLGDE